MKERCQSRVEKKNTAKLYQDSRKYSKVENDQSRKMHFICDF